MVELVTMNGDVPVEPRELNAGTVIWQWRRGADDQKIAFVFRFLSPLLQVKTILEITDFVVAIAVYTMAGALDCASR